MAAGRLYKVNELVQVESIDAGFEGAWFDAAIHKIVNVALPDSGTEAEPRIMYDVKYTRFASAGKPIVESVCEARIRPVPPELVEYEVAVGDHVDAFWRDGWWQGVILKIDEESTVPGENTSKAHVSKGMTVKKYFVGFPQHAHQELCLRKDDLRPVLQLRQAEGPWYHKISKRPSGTDSSQRGDAASDAAADAASADFEWVALDPMSHKLRGQASSRKRPAPTSSVPAAKQQREREPFPEVPAAPTYYPSEEQFAEPFKYILSIKAEAAKFGICKIVPPPNWKPSWSIDSRSFMFDTRIQNVHQLQERGEFLFWKRLKKSLAKRGMPLTVVPRLDGKQLNLFALYRWVVHVGGHEHMDSLKWMHVANELKVPAQLPHRANQVHQIYKTYLLDFEAEEKQNMQHKATVASIDSEQSKPVFRSPNALPTPAAGQDMQIEKVDQRCEICFTADDPGNMLLCDACDGGYHTFCLRPKETVVPHGNWYCSRCKLEQVEEVMGDEPFGFEDGPKYTLTTFHTLADSYKQRWFSGCAQTSSPHNMGIEQEFWNIVEEGLSMHDVQVLYGADLPTIKHGSGFAVDPTDPYSSHPWNLNVMPTLPGSLLRHLERTVSGLIAPWLYVGMLFAAFCWHNEDNYLYSINYMHWGSTKTWYGVPGRSAEAFEAVMRASMPELFSYSPDLLYHITTMLSPRRLMEKKVPCYKLNQQPGEYIITFPEAYHGGFSHGFNCCEAVNFATADWLDHGFKAAARYRDFKHIAAFSVTKLLFQVILAPLERKMEDGLETLLLLEKHTRRVVQEERNMRDDLVRAGLKMTLKMEHAPAAPPEDGDEDGRLCTICKTNCWLSYVTCPCSPNKAVALFYAHKLCSCGAPSNLNRSCIIIPISVLIILLVLNCVLLVVWPVFWLLSPDMSRRILFFRHSVSELDQMVESCSQAVAEAKRRQGVGAADQAPHTSGKDGSTEAVEEPKVTQPSTEAQA